MPTQAMFEGQIEDVLGADPEAASSMRRLRPLPSARRAACRTVAAPRSRFDRERLACVRGAAPTAPCSRRSTGCRRGFGTSACMSGVKPAIVIGRHGGAILFLLPFALEANGFVRKITWLGSCLCNYNGPLVARDFSRRVSPAQFVEVWREVQQLLRRQLRHDLIDLEKMPKVIGEQANPFCALARHAARQRRLSDDAWPAIGKPTTRRSARRRRARPTARSASASPITARPASSPPPIATTWCGRVDALIDEKRRSYAKLGVANMFERPGYRDFFLDLATGPRSSRLTHVSRLDVGDETAAANFGLMFRGRYYYILAGYDDGELARFGPGRDPAHGRDALCHSSTAASCSISPSATSPTSASGATSRSASATTSRRRRCAAGWRRCRRWRCASVKRRIKRNPAVWAVVRKLRMLTGSLRG